MTISNKFEIKKFAAASRSWGRGMDNYRTPAKYNIVLNGVIVGKLWGKQQGYMGKPQWEISTVAADGHSNLRPLKTVYGTKTEAVEWIQSNFQS